jgi:hypothetical protein
MKICIPYHKTFLKYTKVGILVRKYVHHLTTLLPRRKKAERMIGVAESKAGKPILLSSYSTKYSPEVC